PLSLLVKTNIASTSFSPPYYDSLLLHLSPLPLRSTLFPYTTLFRSRRRARPLYGRSATDMIGLYLLMSVGVAFGIFVLFMAGYRSEEHTSELQSRFDLVCRLLLENKNNTILRNSFYCNTKHVSL